MPSIEAQLISHIVSTGDLAGVKKWGITSDDFLIEAHKQQFLKLESHSQIKGADGKPMGVNAFLEATPDFEICHDKNTAVEYLCEQVRYNRVAVQAEEVSADIARALQRDPIKAISMGEERYAKLRMLLARKDVDVTWVDSYARAIENYKLRESGVMTGVCTYPWHPLNDVTPGVERGDYIVFYGRPKSYKSWVLAWFLVHAYFQGLRVLVYTKEMTPDNIFERMSAILAQVDYHNYKTCSLTEEERSSFFNGIDYIRNAQKADGRCIIALKGNEVGEGRDTVSWLSGKVDEHKPHIVGIDGMYLMSADIKTKQDHERVRCISRSIRAMILAKGVPVVATLQANRQDSDELRDMAHSDALGQDPTGIYRCVNDKDSPTISVIATGAREYRMNGFRIWAKPAVSFGFHSLLTADQVEKAKEGDTGEAEADPASHAKSRKKKGKAMATNRIMRSIQAAAEDMSEAVQVGYRTGGPGTSQEAPETG